MCPNVLATPSPSPLFGVLPGDPHIFDFSSQNPVTWTLDPANFDEFQRVVYDELHRSGCSWGIGKYLEERGGILRKYPQMINEGRTVHAGLDIIMPEGSILSSPLDAVVHAAGKEEGLGNYGGYIILQHTTTDASSYFSFHGHLHSRHLVSPGESLRAGEAFGKIGGGNDSGGWFCHSHLQIITEKAANAGRFFQGYVSAQDLPHVKEFFPDPHMLFRAR